MDPMREWNDNKLCKEHMGSHWTKFKMHLNSGYVRKGSVSFPQRIFYGNLGISSCTRSVPQRFMLSTRTSLLKLYHNSSFGHIFRLIDHCRIPTLMNSLMYPHHKRIKQISTMFTSFRSPPKSPHLHSTSKNNDWTKENISSNKKQTNHHPFCIFAILCLIIQWQRTYSWSPSHWNTGKHRIRRLRCQGRRRGGTEGGSHTSDQWMKAPKLVTCGEHIVGH